MNKLSAIDLFSGCGGLTQGLRRAGFSVLAAVEMDAGASEVYRTNHPSVDVWGQDIREIDVAAFMKKLGLKREELMLLACCPPCQGFSTLKTRNGSAVKYDHRNGLIHEVTRFVSVLLPKAVMLENVPALARQNSFLKFCAALRSLGYHVRWDIQDTWKYGVPQRRRRLILVAGRGLDIPFANEAKKTRTVRDALKGLPAAGTSGDELHDLPERRSERIARMIRAIPKDGGSRRDLPKAYQLACHKRTDGFYDVYGRMSWDRPSPTITGGCFNPSKGRFLHPEFDRAITLREASLLQTFPKSYKFPISVGKEALALMIGNALPPEFTTRHARALAKAITRLA
jgi:DNA (cytosine-5)-methyltransferase 1